MVVCLFQPTIRVIGNHSGSEGQPYYESIGHLYEYLKPETFPSLTTLDVHDFIGILFILLFDMIIEGQLCELVGEGNPIHFQFINIRCICRIPLSLLGASILDFEEFCKDLINGKYPGIKEINGRVGILYIEEVYEIGTNYYNHTPTSTYLNLYEHGYYHNDNIINSTFGSYQEQVSLDDDDIDTFIHFMKANPTKHLTKLHCKSILFFDCIIAVSLFA